MRGGTLLAVACAATAGCVPIDPYRGPDDDTPIVVLTSSGDPNTDAFSVRGGTFFVEFSEPGPTGARYPSSIELGGVEVLGRTPACNGEDGVGMTLFPAFGVSSRNPTSIGATEILRIERAGPANVRVQVTWQYPYVCSGISTIAYGSSRFSFFPDGRVVRSDTLEPTQFGDLASGGTLECGCGGPPAEYYMTSYIALRDPAFRRIHYARITDPESSEDAPLPIDPGPELFWISDPNPTWACVGTDGDAAGPFVGIAWTPATTDNNGTRIRGDVGEEPNTVLIWDWLYYSQGTSAVPVATYPADTALFLGVGPAAACSHAAMAQRAAAFSSPSELTILDNLGGNRAVGLTRSDGIYHWELGAPTPLPTSFEVRSGRDIPPGYAISLRWPGAQLPIVRLDGIDLVNGTAYLPDLVEEAPGEYELVLWIRAGLTPSDVLTISVP